MSNKEILVVDDDKDTLLRLNKRFKLMGYDVSAASDAVTATGIARNEKPDLIILDIGLPGGDGFLVLERLKSIPSMGHIPVIIFSASEAVDKKEKAFKSGAEIYVQKSGNADELLSAVNKVLGGSTDQTGSEPSREKALLTGSKKKILIVDDDKDTLIRLNRRLQKKGYDVVEVTD